MAKLKLTAHLIILAAAAFLLAACGASRSSNTPTPDSNTVKMGAAATANARLTEMGPRTAEPSTTPYMTRTPTPETTPTIPRATNTSQPLGPAATNTSNPSTDIAEWISQSPNDGATIPAGSGFKMTWTVKNVGKSTWTRAYQLRYYAAERLGGPSAVNLSKDVPPGEQIDISVDLTAPTSSGDYHSIWVITSDKGGNFYPLDIKIKVGAAQAATVTPTLTSEPATPTPTVTTAACEGEGCPPAP